MAAALVVAGCGGQAGGGDAGGGSPSAVVSDYFREVDRADGRAICSHLAPQAQRDIASLQGRTCPKAMAAEARRLPESLNGYEILGESASGEIATVTVQGLGSREEISLRRFGGSWRITDAPGLGL